jgi:hypothetical protein
VPSQLPLRAHPKSAPPTPRQPILCWPAVVAAGALALLFMVGMTLAVSAGSRPAEVAKASPPVVVPTPETDLPLTLPPETTQAVAPAPTPPVKPAPVPVVELAPLPSAEAPACGTGDTYGTAVLFSNSPAEAGRQAAQEKKLLFVLHLSGNLEDDAFT